MKALATGFRQQYREHTLRGRKVYDQLFYGVFHEAEEAASPELNPASPIRSKRKDPWSPASAGFGTITGIGGNCGNVWRS